MSGFVDLRLNRRRTVDDGFWPSFTDIMTVIVMIFLMGMVVVLLQNMEVTNNMKSALLEKQKATELAKSTFEEKSIVSHRLSDAEEELARLRMMIILAKDQRKTMEQQLSTAKQELQTLSVQFTSLEQAHNTVKDEKQQADRQLEDKAQLLAQTSSQLSQTSSQLSQAESQLNDLVQQQKTLIQQQTILTSELASSREAQAVSESRLEAITLQATSTDQELASIRGEYSDLQVKYNKLIKPARTSKGKYVVEVFYSKSGNKDLFKIKDSGQASSTIVSQKQLHQRLAKLKKQHDKNLYIRLIFPEDSNLSYNDAWTFSKEVLGKYDYYHTN